MPRPVTTSGQSGTTDRWPTFSRSRTRLLAASPPRPKRRSTWRNAKCLNTNNPHKQSTDFKARDLVAQAWGVLYDQTPEAIAEASDLVEEAIRIDPSNPVAHRVRGAVFLNRMWFGETPRDAPNVARAFELARTALRLAPHDEMAHLLMVWAYMEAGSFEDAVAECDRVLEINPSCSIIRSNLGACLALLGRPQEGVWAGFKAQSSRSVEFLAPLVHRSGTLCSGGLQRGAAGEQESSPVLEKPDEARAAVEHCLAQRSNLRVGNVVPDVLLRFARNEDHERLLALLRKAGLPA